MWAYPGKKLLFMGQEFAQGQEWNSSQSLDWHLLDHPWHRGVQALVRDCNLAYRDLPALHERDCEGEGFQWIVVDDRDNSVFAWLRHGADGSRTLAMVANFTPVPRERYLIGLPHGGRWREALNSDGGVYGGSNCGNAGVVVATARPQHGFDFSAGLTLPPLGTLWLVHDDGQ
jgi:1,4-alpha-glucan branching enzyme